MVSESKRATALRIRPVCVAHNVSFHFLPHLALQLRSRYYSFFGVAIRFSATLLSISFIVAASREIPLKAH